MGASLLPWLNLNIRRVVEACGFSQDWQKGIAG